MVLGTNDTIHMTSVNQYEMTASPRDLIGLTGTDPTKESSLLSFLLQSITFFFPSSRGFWVAVCDLIAPSVDNISIVQGCF